MKQAKLIHYVFHVIRKLKTVRIMILSKFQMVDWQICQFFHRIGNGEFIFLSFSFFFLVTNRKWCFLFNGYCIVREHSQKTENFIE